MSVTTIDVLLIRHGESEENMKMQGISEGISRLKEGKLMSRQHLSHFWKMFSFDIDSKLSLLGLQQIQEMKNYLDSKQFWQQKFNFHQVIYSPYERTRVTCYGIIPSHYHEKCLPLEELKEISPYEYAFQTAKLDDQIFQFRKWLHHEYLSITENSRKLVIIGHARYFQRLLTLFSSSPSSNGSLQIDEVPFMRNCDMWKTQYTFLSDDITSGKFSQPNLLYRSPFSYSYRVDHNVFSWTFWKKTDHKSNREDNYLLKDELISDEDHHIYSQNRASSIDETVSGAPPTAAGGEDEDEEPTCRICQVLTSLFCDFSVKFISLLKAKRSETPGQKMFRPCLCAGSLAYVHLDCLNQWRSTSEAANSTCSICHYKYRVQENLVSQILLKQGSLILVSVLFACTVIVLSGFILQFVLQRAYPKLALSKHQVINYLYEITLPAEQICKHPRRNQLVVRMYGLEDSRFSGYVVNTWIWIACTPIPSAILESFLLGSPIIAAIGYLISSYHMIRRAIGNEGGWRGIINISFLWFGNDLPFMIRMFTIMGCFTFIKDFMEEYSVALRKWSHSLGDEVKGIDE